MSENLANDTQTLLNGGINNAVTAITTTGNTGFPAANFRVLVDNELMLVTSVGGGTNWTVQRGIENTTAIAHLDQAPIVHVVTTTGLTNFIREQALSLPMRQTILAGALASGAAAFFAAGSGLALNLSCTATAMQIAFAGGYSNVGEVDFVSQVSADVTGFVSGLPANNTSYISATYVDPNSVTWNQTLFPPQYGYTYDRTKQFLLHFEGTNGATTTTDDYGNAVVLTGATITTTNPKIGTSCLVGGAAKYAEVTDLAGIVFPNTGWTIEGWFTPAGAQVVNGRFFCFNQNLATNDGVQVYTTDATHIGVSVATVQQILGTFTIPANGTWFHLALSYDALGGKLYLYGDGVSLGNFTVANTFGKIRNAFIGTLASALTTFNWNGSYDECSFVPYCKYPAGTTFTPATVAGTVTGDFFSIPKMKMFGATGASSTAGVDPTFTAKNLVYAGEADTGAATVSAVRNYAYQGKYEGPLTSLVLATATTFGHNIGVLPRYDTVVFVPLINDGNYFPGEEHISSGVFSSNNNSIGIAIKSSRNVITSIVGGTAVNLINMVNGIVSPITLANWKYKVYANRGW